MDAQNKCILVLPWFYDCSLNSPVIASKRCNFHNIHFQEGRYLGRFKLRITCLPWDQLGPNLQNVYDYFIIQNLEKYVLLLFLKTMTMEGYTLAHVMAAELSWHARSWILKW